MKLFNKIHSLMLWGVSAFLLAGCGAGIGMGSSSSSVMSSSSVESSVQSSLESSSNSISSVVVVSSSSSSESSTSSAKSLGFVVGTLAHTAGFNGDGLRLDKKGNVYVGTSVGHQVFRVTPDGAVSLFASFASGSANGSYFDSKGNLYVANEAAGIIQKITPDGELSDFITGMDGPAGIYIDKKDNLYVSMFGYASPAATVLKITPDKTITTYASGGGLTNVVGITSDGKGRYFAANFFTGEIFEITDRNVTQIGAAGTRVNHMQYSNGYIYMPSPFNHVVRRMDLQGNFEVIAGTMSVPGSEDGDGAVAKFSRPNSIDISKDGKTIYILDFNTGDVRTISLTH